MNILMEIIAGVSLATIGVLIALLTLYVKIYKSTRAVFTVGLIFFTGMLLLQNIIAVYAYFAMESLYSEGLLSYFMAIQIAELAGVSALLKVTL
jgi:hypothetical protein